MFDPDVFWKRWGDMTRLIVGLDAASDDYIAAWQRKLEAGEVAPVIAIPWRGKSDFKAPADELLGLLADKGHLARMLLVHSYAIAEAFAADMLAYLGDSTTNATCGIEAWSQRLIKLLKVDWSRVKDGKLGLMEVAMARNAIVHGFERYSDTEWDRSRAANVKPAWKVGDLIPLTQEDVLGLRYRLQCFLRVLSQAVVEHDAAAARLKAIAP